MASTTPKTDSMLLLAAYMEPTRVVVPVAIARELELAVERLRAALIAVLPFIDDASDVHDVFPESAASSQCRAAVAEAKAALVDQR